MLASPIPRPKIYVYELPEDLRVRADTLAGSDKERALADRVRNDPEYYTSDASTADYWWIPGQVSLSLGDQILLWSLPQYE